MHEIRHVTLKEISQHLGSSIFEEPSALSEMQQRHLIECELCGELAKILTILVDKLTDRMIERQKALREVGHLSDFEIEALFILKRPDEKLARRIDSHALECAFCRGRVAERLVDAYEEERKKHR